MRRWKRRLLWAAVLLGLAVLAIPATVAQGWSGTRAFLVTSWPASGRAPVSRS